MLVVIGFIGFALSGLVSGNSQFTATGASYNNTGPIPGLSGCVKHGFEIASQIWICPNLKPLKPGRALEREKDFCAPKYGVCNLAYLQKAFNKWSKRKDGWPKGCYAFRMGEKKKAGGFGGSCHKNLYFDGVLCCSKFANKQGREMKNKERRQKLRFKSTHFIHNLVK